MCVKLPDSSKAATGAVVSLHTPIESSPANRRAVAERGRLTLRAIREGLGRTQGELAHALDTDQGEVSRIERRPEIMLSTLRRYAAALGATCEIAFVFPNGRRVLVADPEPGEPPR